MIYHRPEMRLLIFGLGYSGTAIAHAAIAAGIPVTATSRSANKPKTDGVALIAIANASDAISDATHIICTAPPDASGDPILKLYRDAISTAPLVSWLGYLSTTGVYGDRNGDWVDERTPPAPGSDRSRWRVAAEQHWQDIAQQRPIDIFRLAGIYGPGRSAFDTLRAGRALRVIKPGHAFGRIHRDDIARAVVAAMLQPYQPGVRLFNLADNEPAESADVLAEAARLLGVPPPPEVPFAQAWATMSPMARSFWAENRKVSSRWTQKTLGLTWRYPTYREGLRAILAEERGERPT
jgi:nucleoside-diphosphate-sugar epimerase